MVSWGANTTHEFSSAATPATGSAAPAPLFGASATPPPGGSGIAPAPSTGGFSTPTLTSTPAPAAPSFGFAPAPSAPAPSAPAPSGLFGATAAPSPASFGLFGAAPAQAPAPAFGASPAAPMFGAPQQQQQQQQQQVPAQAAMQAHMDASARQEQARIMTELETLYAAYTGAPPRSSNEKVPFLSIVYDDVSPEQLQLQWMHRMGSHGGATVVPPPKPSHVSEKEWIDAVVRNPDPELYMPAALLGADALRMRVVRQQEKATFLAKSASQLQTARDTVQAQCQRFQSNVQHLARTHAALRSRLLDVMRKCEVVRNMNLQLQHDEVKAGQRLSELLRQVEKTATALTAIQDKVRTQPHFSTPAQAALPDETQLLQILQEQRQGIESLTETVKRDMRDIGLLQQRVVQKIAVPRTK